jgi:phosphatidate cytidylyltransferase
MMAGGKWGDLPARVLSAIVMLAVGLLALVQGGVFFHLLIALLGGGMVWELTRMMAQDKPGFAIQMGVAAALALIAPGFLPPMFYLPVLLAPAFAGAMGLSKDRLIYGAYVIALMLACFGLLTLREFRGVEWVLWLVLVVVATDIAGYFAGRLIGGPKFWPSVSPKKTWSGTSAGWVAAAIVGFVFAGPFLAAVSVATSFASQLGDIAESAIKRRYGIKDSSQLIPGHGGLLDRFDGMMAAALLVLIVANLIGLPHHLK